MSERTKSVTQSRLGFVPAKSRFLSKADCDALITRVVGLATGGGDTTVEVDSSWTGNIRFGRNQVSSAGDVRDNEIVVRRVVRNAGGAAQTNQIDDAGLVTTLRRAERLVELSHERPADRWEDRFTESYSSPPIWSDATYNLDTAARAAQVEALLQPIVKAGMRAAGYLQVAAHGRSTMNGERRWYYPYTLAQFSLTVRDPQGTGSGWAGIDDNDWLKIDAAHLAEVALDKCLRSRNPVAVEPGRYTAILEPQAVCDFIKILFTPSILDRDSAENGNPRLTYPPEHPRSVYNTAQGLSKIGRRIMDERLSVSSDPMDPLDGFPPFWRWNVFQPVTWVRDGVLLELAYGREYAVKLLSKNTGGLQATGAFRMSVRGPTVSVDEMVASTKRGVLVTRFWGIPDVPLDPVSMMLTGYTRDGLWLIENGKIAKPIKNFRFTESPILALNNIEQIGEPRRVFRPNAPRPFDDGYAPVVVPALKIRDFNFSALSDAV